MENIVIIPCRMGSKGIKHKNLQLLGGETLLEKAVKAGSELSDRVFVSSESFEIKELCLRNNWKFLERPMELASDLSTDYEFISYHLTNDFSLKPSDYLTLMRPSSPLRTRDALQRLRQIIEASDHEISSIRSVVDAPSTPYKMWYEKEDFLKPLPLANPKMLAEPFNSPRQILPEIFWQTGTYDVYRVGSISNGKLSGNQIKSFHAFHPEVDIDQTSDLDKANKIYLTENFNWI